MNFSDDLFVLPPTSGGATTDFKLLTATTLKTSALDIYAEPIILVDDSVDVKTTDIHTVDINKVLAVNGPAIIQILTDLPSTHPLNELVFKNDKKLIKNDVVPEQVVFIALFNQLFFLGVANDILSVSFTASFKDKFEGLKLVYEDHVVKTKKGKYFDEDAKLTLYVANLQNLLKVKSVLPYAEFKAAIVGSGIYSIMQYIQNGTLSGGPPGAAADAPAPGARAPGAKAPAAAPCPPCDNEEPDDDLQFDESLGEVRALLDKCLDDKDQKDAIITQCNDKLKAKDAQIKKLTDDLNDSKAEEQDIREKYDELKSDLRGTGSATDLKSQLALAIADNKEKNDKIRALEKQVNQHRDYDDKVAELSACQSELADTKAELKKKEDELKDCQDMVMNLRLLLAARSSSLQVDMGKNSKGEQLEIGDIVEEPTIGDALIVQKTHNEGIVLADLTTGAPDDTTSPTVLKNPTDPTIVIKQRKQLTKKKGIKRTRTQRFHNVITTLRKNKKLTATKKAWPFGKYKDGTDIMTSDRVEVNSPGQPKTKGIILSFTDPELFKDDKSKQPFLNKFAVLKVDDTFKPVEPRQIISVFKDDKTFIKRK
jgi:hypothetical protein